MIGQASVNFLKNLYAREIPTGLTPCSCTTVS